LSQATDARAYLVKVTSMDQETKRKPKQKRLHPSAFQKVEERMKSTGFTSVPSYVTYLLRQITVAEETEDEEPFSKGHEERIKARISALGYID